MERLLGDEVLFKRNVFNLLIEFIESFGGLYKRYRLLEFEK